MSRFLAARYRHEFNHYRPHSSRGMRTPAEFAARLRDEQAKSTSAA